MSEADHHDVSIGRILERLDALNAALALQAREYERRLGELNHSHQEALRVQHTYVTLDKYEDAIETIRKQLELLNTFRSRAILIGGAISMFSGLIGALLMKAFGG